MNQQELQKETLVRIGLLIRDLGFKPLLSKQEYRMPMSFGRVSFHVAFVKHVNSFFLVGDVGLRVDDLEDLKHSNGFKSYLSEKEKKQTYSFGCELGNISGIGQKRWKISSESDVEKAVKLITNEFIQIGMPYLEKYSELNEAFKVFSSDKLNSDILNVFPDEQAVNAISLAFLLNNGSLFFDIIEKQVAYLRKINDQNIEDVLMFITNISNQYKKLID